LFSPHARGTDQILKWETEEDIGKWQPRKARKGEKEHDKESDVDRELMAKAASRPGRAIMLLGGENGWGGKRSVEVLDLQESRAAGWAACPPSMKSSRFAFGAAHNSGSIYVMGGESLLLGGSKSAERFDYSSSSAKNWTVLSPMKKKRQWLGCAVLNDSIYAIGGSTDTGEFYDIPTNQWHACCPLKNGKRSGLAAVSLEGLIYAIGGRGEEGSLSSMESFDERRGRWEQHASMLSKRASLGAVVVDGKIYAIGGTYKKLGIHTKMEVYDPRKDQWQEGVAMLLPRRSMAAVADGQKIYVIGGSGIISAMSSVHTFDTTTQTWTEEANSIMEARNDAAAVVVD